MSVLSYYIPLAALLVVAPTHAAPTAKTVRKATIKAPAAASPVLAKLKLEFVPVASGEFVMGSSTGMIGEQPTHSVRLTRGFDIGKYEVTQAQWQELMGSNPSKFPAADHPVENISWNEAQEFLKKLNAADPAHNYRLPTEAEWEYAARAGTTGDYPGELDDIAWYYPNSDQQTHPVGKKLPNPWGLYDTHGNVWEWCQDYYNPNYYGASPAINPPGPEAGMTRVLRGGSWGANLAYTRSSVRIDMPPFQKNPYFGFRIVREAKKK
jgi:formylglycine-generating enzyme required for sulfatase activity